MNARLLTVVPLMLAVCSLGTIGRPVARAESGTRTWTDSSGAFTVEAEFVDFVEGKVRLERTDGKIITVSIEKLSKADQKFIRSQSAGPGKSGASSVLVTELTGKPKELALDDGKAAGQKSFPMGHATAFDAPGDSWYLTSVRIHGSRYGHQQPPKEDFHVSLCDKDFKLITDFPFPYSKFRGGPSQWVTLRVKPTKVPSKFVICLNFKATRTKGVFVSHDAKGKALVGLPGKMRGYFTAGDWLIRVTVDQLKGAGS